MSCKSNGIKLTKCDSQQWKTASFSEAPSVKFAGEEAKDRLYEPKHKKKIVRVLTVVAYVFFVSLAAIMLSLYYLFLWNGEQRVAAKLISRQQQQEFVGIKCENILAEMQRQIRILDTQNLPTSTTSTTSLPLTSTTAESTTWYDDNEDFGNLEDLRKNSNFFKKLLSEYTYNDID